MDTYEIITLARTSVDDEVNFLDTILRNRKIRLIKSKATLTGPVYLTLDEFRKIKISGSEADCQIYLWNTGLAHRLRWSPYLSRYDATWSPIDDEFGGSPMRQPRTKEDYEALHFAFRRQPITGRLFRYGRFIEQFSPILAINVSSEKIKEKTNGLFTIKAQFSNWINRDIWLVWNGYIQHWEHEIEDVDDWADTPYEQPEPVVLWQEQILDMLRKAHPRKIVPEKTIRE